MAIRLVTLLKRKEGLTHEEFLEYWFGIHGPLIANGSAAGYVRRYEQQPVAWPTKPGAAEPEYDGITMQWFDSMEAFHAHTTEPDFPDVMADTERFLDMSKIVVVLTEEPNVVLGD